MNPTKLITFVLGICVFMAHSHLSFAIDNAARFAGDITLNLDSNSNNTGIHFSNGTYQNSASPWSFDALNPGTIFYNAPSNKVGIGTFSPNSTLDVNGAINATSFTGDGSGITNVTASSVAAGAVGDSQISGIISAGKLDLSGVQKKYGKTAVVALTGGDYANPILAMNSLSSWCGIPTASNSCLLKILPGTYDMGTSSLVMQPYVDIEGSGVNTTILSATVVNVGNQLANGVVNGADHSELRSLTIKNLGATNNVIGVANVSASPNISNVNVLLSGASIINVGIYNSLSSSVLKDVKTAISGSSTVGVGVANTNSNVSLVNVSADVTGNGENSGVINRGASPVISSSTFNISGGTYAYGIQNLLSATSKITNVDLMVSNASIGTYGISNDSSSPKLVGVVAKATSVTGECAGIMNSNSSPNITNSTASSSGGDSGSYGVSNFGAVGSFTLNIDRSDLSGATNSISNDAAYVVLLGASKLDGPINNVGVFVCAGSYSGSYQSLNGSCQ